MKKNVIKATAFLLLAVLLLARLNGIFRLKRADQARSVSAKVIITCPSL